MVASLARSLEEAEEALAQTLLHLQGTYPREGCGVILSDGGRCWFRPMRNVVDRYHAADPSTFPQDSRTAYLFDPREQREVWEEAARGGWTLEAIVHSHCDVDASFSALDEAMATTAAGHPLHHGVPYLVVALAGGRFREARLHAFVDGAWRGVPFSLRAASG